MDPTPSIPEHDLFIRVEVQCIPVILKALRENGFLGVANEVENFAKDFIDPQANAERLRWVAIAQSEVAKDGVIEFDEDATISHTGEHGQYVLGWVFVEDPNHENAVI